MALETDLKKFEKNEINKTTKYHETTFIFGAPKVGKDVWIGPFVVLDATGGFEIGDNSVISAGVHIYSHDTVKQTIQNLSKDRENYSHVERSPVKIGKNTFIGGNSTILKGITIGDHCVIGAGSVVNTDIPSGSVVAGVPAKIISKISQTKYSNEELKKLYP